jgi:hypothetical protein
MRGGATLDQQTYTLRVKNVVALTISLSVPLADFRGAEAAVVVQNLATLLGISASRIRIVSVHAPGKLDRRRAVAPTGNTTTVLAIEISDEQNKTATTDAAAAEQLAQFDDLMNTLTQVAGNGSLLESFNAAGLPVAELVMLPPAGWGGNTEAVTVTVSDGSTSGGPTDGSSSGASTGLIIGASVAGAIFIVLLVGVVVMAHRVRARHIEVKSRVGRPGGPSVHFVMDEIVPDYRRPVFQSVGTMEMAGITRRSSVV